MTQKLRDEMKISFVNTFTKTTIIIHKVWDYFLKWYWLAMISLESNLNQQMKFIVNVYSSLKQTQIIKHDYPKFLIWCQNDCLICTYYEIYLLYISFLFKLTHVPNFTEFGCETKSKRNLKQVFPQKIDFNLRCVKYFNEEYDSE